MAQQASEDFLLRNFVFDIKRQSYILIFETKCKLFRTIDMPSMGNYFGTSTPIERAVDEIERHLNTEGFEVFVNDEDNTLSCKAVRGFEKEIEI